MTRRPIVRIACLATLALGAELFAQTAVQSATRPQAVDWRHIGNAAIDVGLAGVATGPVDRVWYSEDGSTLFVRTRAGGTYSTDDFEIWKPAASAKAPDAIDARIDRSPEPAMPVRVRQAARGRLYAAGRFVYRSEDNGRNWSNLTAYESDSIIGDGILDLAVSPRESDDISVVGGTGVWRSVDAGITWTSLNAGLPNLTFTRILATPSGVRGLRIASGSGAFEWAPGERTAWRAIGDLELKTELERNARLTRVLGVTITASAASGDTLYAGSEDGRLFASADAGVSWKPVFRAEAGRIERIVVDAQDPGIALAAIGARPAELSAQTKAWHLARTLNGGAFWDNFTANLPDVPAHGVAFDRASSALYVATDKGVFTARTDLNSLSIPSNWNDAGAGLPEGVPVVDVRLDSGANQLYAGLLGLGVYSTAAPHRRNSPRVVNAADYSSRAVAPGSVLTVFGSPVVGADAGGVRAPVLASNELRSEIQIPFNVSGSSLSLAVDAGSGSMLHFGLPLQAVSPAIVVGRDGAPWLLDADSGALLDSMTPAHPGGRLQILSTGLGRVNPDWPAGVKAPADNPPAVSAKVRAYLDGQEVGVANAVLAPGYVGFYLVEIQLPSIVNSGPAELTIVLDGKESNRVRLYVEP